jgi:hypothetical protein
MLFFEDNVKGVNSQLKKIFEELRLDQDQDQDVSDFETYVIVCNIYLISCIFSEDGGRWPLKHVRFLYVN